MKYISGIANFVSARPVPSIVLYAGIYAAGQDVVRGDVGAATVCLGVSLFLAGWINSSYSVERRQKYRNVDDFFKGRMGLSEVLERE